MNKVFFNSEGIELPSWTPAAKNFVKAVLKKLDLDNWELSVLFCNNSYIKELNTKFRNKDEATDVISFPLDSAPGKSLGKSPGEKGPSRRFMAGDIAISLDALEENSRFFKVSADEELRRLLVHGILHLRGEDHATNNADEPMLIYQEEILRGVTENIL